MTAVSRAAEAPRAASSISSSSIKWCCTGGTSGCRMNTSASRQLASSCTPRQSLLNVDVVEGLSGLFRRLQIARASSVCALPLKTTILFMRGEHHTRANARRRLRVTVPLIVTSNPRLGRPFAWTSATRWIQFARRAAGRRDFVRQFAPVRGGTRLAPATPTTAAVFHVDNRRRRGRPRLIVDRRTYASSLDALSRRVSGRDRDAR